MQTEWDSFLNYFAVRLRKITENVDWANQVWENYNIFNQLDCRLQVSLVGVLFLFGLYVSSLSSCLGAQYGAPRILQCISKENIIPLIKPLGSGVSS